ncbi:hypothetical protein B0A48_01401 [Cryoendolithus antarcticus]|uniref:Uncharacterized protein n=1 Tax=Cryoendolithus antarcticus TaxID=1507870 RepID=A0A1V8TT65_9PEZI|nr:hypothetical protein B0A48_01401 [Cryoendolithus antarcticus]
MAPRKAPETQPTRRSGRIEAAKVIQQAILDDQRSKVTKPKRFRRPQQRKRCLLLNKLPGEIRNMIWHYAVVQNPITVTSSGPGEPGLLRASRQIRRETRAMYYSANEFIVEVMDYDGAALTPWSRQHYRYANAESCCKILMLGEPDWGNLMRWCKDVAQTPCALIPALEQKKPKCDCGQHNHYPDDDVAEGMIRIADELRWNLGWASVEKVLEGAHQAVTARNRDWA